jgi:hypothetical protein
MNRKQINKESKKREQAVAKEIGGKRHAGSGSVWWQKGDASNQDFLFEDKFKLGFSYALSIGVLSKLEKQARNINKIPVLRFGFHNEKAYAVLRAQDCMRSNKVEITTSFGKSHTFHAQDLERYFLYATCTYMHITFITEKEFDKSYNIMEWEYFLEVKDKIVKGEMI